MKRVVSLAAVAALAALLAAAPAAHAQARPDLTSAAAAILIDAGDGTVLLQKDADERRSIASTTKLMTALLALERARPRERFVAPPYDALPVESKIDLRAGESMTVADLLEALLLESANDAAVTIAEGVSGTREAFVADMNERAAQLGLRATSYANPIGLDDPLNYSTARDLSALAAGLLRKPRFARIVDKPSAVLASGARTRVVDNRNTLVAEYPFVTGVKTGFTGQAGNVLVGSASGKGAQVVSVVMGEPSEAQRDADTLALLRYGLAQFRRRRVLDEQRSVATAAIEYRDERARLVPAHGLNVTVRRGQRVRRQIAAPEELEGPIEAGERVGMVRVYRGGELIRRVPLVTAAEVPGAGALRVITSALGVPLTLLILIGVLAVAVLRLRAVGKKRTPR
jgi:serine-type D-Ala-D-Ala carboxypeptidase (penicillin-binding protein 5/6)